MYRKILLISLKIALISAQFGFPTFPFSLRSFDSFFPKEIGNPNLPFNDGLGSMQTSNAKTQMKNGEGGVTIIQSPKKTLLRKDATTFECLGRITHQKPYCLGNLRRFETRQREDYCYSENYSQIGNYICIPHNEQHGVNFNSVNGRFDCRGSDERPALLVTTQEYQRMCSKLPGDSLYYYYPDLAKPFHVNLPNPNLGCLQMTKDVCVFKYKPSF